VETEAAGLLGGDVAEDKGRIGQLLDGTGSGTGSNIRGNKIDQKAPRTPVANQIKRKKKKANYQCGDTLQ